MTRWFALEEPGALDVSLSSFSERAAARASGVVHLVEGDCANHGGSCTVEHEEAGTLPAE